MRQLPHPTPDDLPNPPSELISDLHDLYGKSVPVPRWVDEAMFVAARQHAARIGRLRTLLRWGGGAAAAAAIMLVTFRLIPSAPVYKPGSPVTILDAFSLARQIKIGQKPDNSWDLNHDGVIDQKDVDAVAARAVQLTGGVAR